MEKNKWYILGALVVATITYVVTSKSDETRYTSIVEQQERNIEVLKQTINKQKEQLSHVETITVVTYDPTTGNKVKEEIKKVENSSSKETESSVVQKQKIDELVNKRVKEQVAINSKTNTILIGAGSNLDLDRTYSAAYIKRFGTFNVGAEARSDKSATAFVGLSF